MADIIRKRLQYPLPDASLSPFVEVVVHRLPRCIVLGQHPPVGVVVNNVQDGIDNAADGMFAFAPAIKKVFDCIPLAICKGGSSFGKN